MSPITVARQSHRLPGRAGNRHHDGTGKTAPSVGADRAGRHIARPLLRSEQFLYGNLVKRLARNIADRGQGADSLGAGLGGDQDEGGAAEAQSAGSEISHYDNGLISCGTSRVTRFSAPPRRPSARHSARLRWRSARFRRRSARFRRAPSRTAGQTGRQDRGSPLSR